MKKKKLFSLVLATVLTAATVLPCYGASTKEKISNAQAEQAAAQSQLDSIQSRIDELNSKKGQSEEYLSELNQQLDDLQNRLQELQDQYDAKQNELVQIQADLEDAKAKEEEQYEAMKLRIQYMYENSSGNGYMAMLFSSKSISELISRAEYIQKISDFDRDLMQEYEDTVDQVKEKEIAIRRNLLRSRISYRKHLAAIWNQYNASDQCTNTIKCKWSNIIHSNTLCNKCSAPYDRS